MTREVGADIVIDPSQGDLIENVKELTHGQGANVVVETVGADNSLSLGTGTAVFAFFSIYPE